MDRKLIVTGLTIVSIALTACRKPQQPASTFQAGQAPGPQAAAGVGGPPLATKNMLPVAGQQKTCAGPRDKTFDLDVIATTGVEFGMGMTFAAWTYNGHVPGPTIEACQGDTVTINVHNKGTTSHALTRTPSRSTRASTD